MPTETCRERPFDLAPILRVDVIIDYWAAAMRRFLMGTTLITWSTDASIILTAITATITVR
jgi:hypothetical protein